MLLRSNRILLAKFADRTQAEAGSGSIDGLARFTVGNLSSLHEPGTRESKYLVKRRGMVYGYCFWTTYMGAQVTSDAKSREKIQLKSLRILIHRKL